MIGALGSRRLNDVITFEVSSNRILTIQEFVRRKRTRFAKNDTLLRRPVSQYIGPDLDTVTFKIVLKSQFGVDPREVINRLMFVQNRGFALSLILGNRVYGSFRWTIVDLGMPEEIIDNRGFCTSSTLDITLDEYI